MAIADGSVAYDHEIVTIDSDDVLELDSDIYIPEAGAPAGRAVMTLEGTDVRLYYDGSDPASDDGHPLAAGSPFEITGPKNIAHFRFIRTGSDTGTLTVTYER